jgi:peptidyl-prolyl cis-trans isomerase SurA
LKVKEAESLGMDTAQKFIQELAGYRQQLAQPYLVDRSLTDQLIQEAYARTGQDVAAFHILVRVDANASPADTVNAIAKLKKLTAGIKSEADMQRTIATIKAQKDEKVIAEDLGYFTAFSMVYPFESAAYQTEVGKLSKPVRTRFGYHVIFVKDKRPARGEVKVSHIFIRSGADASEEEKLVAKARIDEIAQLIKAEVSFEKLVLEYSEDKATADKGGTLPWFGTGGTSSVFENAAFSLEKNGDISEPIQSSYGWHILRKEDQKEIGSLDELKNSIKKRIEKDSRGLKGRESLLKKLKTEYAITYNLKNRDLVNKLLNDDYLTGKWNYDYTKSGSLSGIALSITDNVYRKRTSSYTQKDYIDYLLKTERKLDEGSLLSTILKDKWEAFVNEKLIEFEDANLEAKYPEFKALMQEYHDGILLFDLMDQKVWSKAVKDSTGLEAFYGAHMNDFMWDKRVDASIYVCADDNVAKSTLKLADKRVKKGYTDGYILTTVNEDNPLNLSIRSGIFAKGDEVAIDNSPLVAGTYKVNTENNRVNYVQIYKIVDPRPKTIEEARGLITSAYQSELEQQWISELRSKYKFAVDETVLSSIK